MLLSRPSAAVQVYTGPDTNRDPEANPHKVTAMNVQDNNMPRVNLGNRFEVLTRIERDGLGSPRSTHASPHKPP